jgi:hypothetical protein
MKRLLLATAIALSPATALAGDFFNVTAVGGSGTTVTAGGSNIINLADNLINQQQQFAALAGQGFNANLTYGGVPSAVVFTENPAQTQATLSIPLTGFSKTFTGTSASDLQNQIKTFLESDGESAYSQLILEIDKQSAVAAIDGNPQSSTAYLADDAFNRYGILSTRAGQIQDADHTTQFTIDGGGGTSRSDGFDGNFANLDIGSQWDLGPSVAIATDTAFQYRSVADSEVYTIGQNLGVPVTLITRPGTDSGFRWQITPWGFIALSASYDQAVGTILVGGGATSSASYRTGDLTFTLGDQINYDGNLGVEVDQYNFDVPIDQWILKNGADVSWQILGSPWFVDAGATYSNFLHHAAVPNYWTGFGGVGVNLSKYAVLRAGFSGDFAPHYTAPGGEITLTVSF